MNDSTRESDQILSAANQSLVTQRDYGGTHRPGPPKWAGSGAERRKNWIQRPSTSLAPS